MISKKEAKFLENLVNNFSKKQIEKVNNYPLLEKGFTSEDIMRGIEVLLSRKLTMSDITKKFENKFSNFVGSKYALMVNSGSSANLLSAFALVNPKKKKRLKPGDKFIIPAICWSTSLWPLVQCGLKPEFIDVDRSNYCLDVNLLNKSTKAKAIMNIHILGNSTNMDKLNNFIKSKNMYMIEDTCEALGSKFKSKHLGTFGDFGTYSFYYSHQITSGEGGMILCNNQKDYEILISLRSHGWSRGIFQNKISKLHPKLDPRYIFYNSGFNLRPLDIQAAMGFSQLKRFNKIKNARTYNIKMIVQNLIKDKRWKNQFEFIKIPKDVKPSFMVMPILLNKKFAYKKKLFIDKLENLGLETRPVISGSFANQPSTKLYKLNKNNEIFRGAQLVEDLGFVIGLHTKKIKKNTLKKINNALFSIDEI